MRNWSTFPGSSPSGCVLHSANSSGAAAIWMPPARRGVHQEPPVMRRRESAAGAQRVRPHEQTSILRHPDEETERFGDVLGCGTAPNRVVDGPLGCGGRDRAVGLLFEHLTNQQPGTVGPLEHLEGGRLVRGRGARRPEVASASRHRSGRKQTRTGGGVPVDGHGPVPTTSCNQRLGRVARLVVGRAPVGQSTLACAGRSAGRCGRVASRESRLPSRDAGGSALPARADAGAAESKSGRARASPPPRPQHFRRLRHAVDDAALEDPGAGGRVVAELAAEVLDDDAHEVRSGVGAPAPGLAAAAFRRSRPGPGRAW